MAELIKNESKVQFNQYVAMTMIHCCSCGVPFAMPEAVREKFVDDPNKYFYCPYGHSQHYSKSTESILREQLKRQKEAAEQKERQLASNAAFWLDHYNKTAEEKRKAQHELRRIKKRVGNGVCPCCNRTFQDLQKHMATKHPEVKEEVNTPEKKKRGRPRKNS